MSDSPSDARWNGAGWRLAVILALSLLPIFLEGFDGQLFFFDAPYIMQNIGAPATLIGLAASAFAIGIVVTSFLGGYLFDRYSAKSVILISLAAFSIFTALTGLATSYFEILTYRLLVGIGIGLFQTSILSFLGYLRPSWRARLLSLFGIFFGIGMAVAPAVGAAFLPGYADAFLMSGALGIISLALFLAFVPGRPVHAAGRKISLSSQLNMDLALLMTAAMAFGVAFFAFESYISDYLIHGLSLPAAAAAMSMSLFGIGAILSAEAFGFASDRYGRKPVLLAGGAMLALSSGILFAPGVRMWISSAAALAFVFGAGYAALVGNVTAAAQDVVDERWIGAATGLVFTTYNVGTILGGPLMGILLIDGFHVAGLSTIFVPSVAILIIISFLRLRRRNGEIRS
ncbi:MAG: MFS transporter [Conexivisphaera sp.]